MEEYKYTFKYQYNDLEITCTFGASLDMDELKRRIRDFLLASSWTEAQVAFLDDDPEEAARAAVMAEQYDRIDRLIKDAKDQEWSAKTILDELERKYIC